MKQVSCLYNDHNFISALQQNYVLYSYSYISFLVPHGLVLTNEGIDDRYRRKRDRLVECAGDAARMPTKWGPFQAYCYRSILDGIEHIAMVKVTTFVS